MPNGFYFELFKLIKSKPPVGKEIGLKFLINLDFASFSALKLYVANVANVAKSVYKITVLATIPECSLAEIC